MDKDFVIRRIDAAIETLKDIRDSLEPVIEEASDAPDGDLADLRILHWSGEEWGSNPNASHRELRLFWEFLGRMFPSWGTRITNPLGLSTRSHYYVSEENYQLVGWTERTVRAFLRAGVAGLPGMSSDRFGLRFGKYLFYAKNIGPVCMAQIRKSLAEEE